MELFMYVLINSLLTFLIGSCVGLAELLSRYSDPYKIFKKKLANYYIILNGSISLMGFWAVKKIQGNFAVTEVEINTVLIAGLSSMVILRSSIANITHQGKKIEIGLGGILQVFLDSVEKLFNRKMSEETLNEIYVIMKDVDFNIAKINLPSICLTTFQNLPKEAASQLGSKIKALSDNGLNHMKSIELGIILEQQFGKDFLKASVDILLKQQDKIKNDAGTLAELMKKFK